MQRLALASHVSLYTSTSWLAVLVSGQTWEFVVSLPAACMSRRRGTSVASALTAEEHEAVMGPVRIALAGWFATHIHQRWRCRGTHSLPAGTVQQRWTLRAAEGVVDAGQPSAPRDRSEYFTDTVVLITKYYSS